jgi:hypothetical protein
MTMPWGDKQAMLIMPTDDDPPTAVVRDWIGGALVAVPELVRMKAAFVTAELVAHARRHGRPPYVLHLSVSTGSMIAPRADSTLVLAVDDSAPELGASWTFRSGLVLIGALSRRWGVDQRPQGKTVWAELAFDTSEVETPDPLA